MLQILRAVVLLFGMLFCFHIIQAQDYTKAIGLRVGYPASVSYKVFLDDTNNAVEAFLSIRNYPSRARNGNFAYRSLGVGAGYLVHNPIQEIDGLYWYYGVGAGIRFYNDEDNFLEDDERTGLVLLGFLGLDYKFKDAPINLSLDWVPAFRIIGFNSGFGGDSGSLAVRYTF